tara:strand:- start:2879 stop:3343 length:465 start_codon:yes stop_codon:yes gene_type:complete
MSISIEAHDRICQDLHQQIRSLIVENEKLRAALAEPACCCGEPSAPGIVHRTDGPCHMAEPVQEPVAWRTFDGEGGYDHRTYEDNEDYAAEWAKRNPRHVGWVEPLYTAPPQRKPLTDEEIQQCFKEAGITIKGQHWTNAVRNVERAHGIGGQP